MTRIGTTVAGTPSTISAASLGLVRNSSTSAPSIMSPLRRNIEKPKPITCRICSVSLVSREAISPVRAESKNAGDKRQHVANTALAQVGDDALAHAHHEVEAHPRRAGENAPRPRRSPRAPRSGAAGRRCRSRRPPRAAAPVPARARSSPRRRARKARRRSGGGTEPGSVPGAPGDGRRPWAGSRRKDSWPRGNRNTKASRLRRVSAWNQRTWATTSNIG